MSYEVEYTDEFSAWWDGLSEGEQDEIDIKVGLLESLGPRLSRPHADTLNGSRHANMKELRADTAGSKLRICFAFDPRRMAILLIGGDKQGANQPRFYKALIEKADKLYDAHLRTLKEEE